MGLGTHWVSVPAKYVFREVADLSEDGSETLLSVSEYYGVSPRVEHIDHVEHLSRAESLVGYKRCKPGDLVINIMLAWKRALGVSDYQGIVSPAYAVFRPDTARLNPRFGHYLLRDDIYVSEFRKLSTGVVDSRLRLYPEVFLRVALKLPALSEQARIANFLDEKTARIDALIAEKERLDGLLGEYRQSWLSELLRSPRSSTRTRLKYCLAAPLQYGATESGEAEEVGPRYIRITDIRQDGTLSDDDVKYLTEEQASRYRLDDGDVLFARSGATVGKSFMYCSILGPAAFAGYLIRGRPNKNVLLPEYLELATETHEYWAHIRGEETQSTIQNASAEKYANFPLWVPRVDEQKALLAAVRPALKAMTELNAHTRKHIEILGEYRASLISRAVTGQLDIEAYKEAS